MLVVLFILAAFSSFGATTTYLTWELGAGYRDSGGRYMAHGLGTYITYSADKAPPSWGHGWAGQETVISGEKNSNVNPPTRYMAVIYRSSALINDSTSNQSPLADGSPYTGGPLQGGSDGNWGNLGSRNPAPVGSLNMPDIIKPDDGNDSPVRDMVNQFYVTYLEGEDGSQTALVHLETQGDNYVAYDDEGNVLSQWPVAMGPSAPVRMEDGTIQWYNPSTGEITADRPNADGSNSSVNLQPVITAVEGVQSRQDLLRQQLIQQLGAAGNSWVYDCKLSLSDLQTLVSALGLKVDSVDSSLSSIDSHVASIDSHSASIDSRLSTIKTSLDSVKSIAQTINNNNFTYDRNQTANLNGIKTVLQEINSKLPDGSETVPVLPSPSLPTDSPDDALPSYLQSFNWDVSTPLSTVQGWTSETGLIKFGLGSLDGWLARFLHVPSVGSDPHMFSVDFNIPYLGHIQRDFSFADWSIIPLFRQVALYALYIFFGFAIYKLLHKTLQ